MNRSSPRLFLASFLLIGAVILLLRLDATGRVTNKLDCARRVAAPFTALRDDIQEQRIRADLARFRDPGADLTGYAERLDKDFKSLDRLGSQADAVDRRC